MRAGGLRHWVTIQSATEARDAVGEPIKTWGTFATGWASIHPRTGTEPFQVQQFAPEATTEIAMRHLDGVTEKMRVLFDTRTYDIQFVQNIGERDRKIVLFCKELR